MKLTLGAACFILYNRSIEGGFAYDKRRGNQGVFLQEHTARDGGAAVVLHFQIRLYEKRRTGLYMALDTLRPALWPPSDVPLDRTGRRLPGNRDCPLCLKLYHRRRDWWFRFGLAADRSRVVCAADGVPTDRRVDILTCAELQPQHIVP